MNKKYFEKILKKIVSLLDYVILEIYYKSTLALTVNIKSIKSRILQDVKTKNMIKRIIVKHKSAVKADQSIYLQSIQDNKKRCLKENSYLTRLVSKSIPSFGYIGIILKFILCFLVLQILIGIQDNYMNYELKSILHLLIEIVHIFELQHFIRYITKSSNNTS